MTRKDIDMKLSYIIVTHNRRETLLHSLGKIHQHTPLPADEWETWLVDNGSTDGTTHTIADRYPQVHQINHKTNQGACARTDAVATAQGEYLVFLDDDSYPTANAVARSIRYLDIHPRAAAVTGTVTLPDGSREASALPAVPIGCALCIRKSALVAAGGFNRRLNRQAEEYDLAFRLLEAGYTLPRFEDIVYHHKKQPGVRSTPLVHRLDLRNNLVIARRYLPAKLRTAYQQDWLMRYTAIGKYNGYTRAVKRGLWEAKVWSACESFAARRTAGDSTIETVFELDKQTHAIAKWAVENRVRRVVIADLGKNIYATHRACLTAGLRVCAVAENHPAFAGMRYRGVSIEPDQQAIASSVDGIVLSNVNPARIDDRMRSLQERFSGPVLRLWHPQYLNSPPQRAAATPQPNHEPAAVATAQAG